ncbi:MULTISPECIES: 5-oxoprolinase subunit PxpA [Rhizobium]|uniref:5-oxoprolinase subunit PxpA n=1 Tax=Rhizobium changzhiense TaxID=2692317 RepID=A0A7Z0ZW32_9HYPH|nr:MULTISPECIES: 5-oxoprolinase subunit PxpA [Rhizobium]MBA5800370.1 5-oxoprolinase subunit PxpA [Rhizobium changzhiense]MCW0018997.1 5-oxoprolinase subunit PxpA [Rhizobium sp. BT-226]NNU48960.1 5-oxoprolinase subunit PxpA [Rhizobium changzhiense]NZD66144.1 5-oxoprolinase subunit PxpA [Rhizobium changzhiense]
MIDAVDINCDMGEAFGRWRVGDTDDTTLMGLISSANIAAGFHAGDPNLMDQTVRLATEHGVGIGAHPGYNDLQGFGRRKIAGTAKELVNDMVYQVGALREFARRHGARLQHVKPHGALYMEMAVDAELSQIFMQYMRTVEPNAYIFCMGGSETYRVAKEAGQPVVREFYADRDYDDTGSIVFTRDAGRPDPAAIARKVVRACREGKVRTVTGSDVDIAFESICFHSDTLGALDIVRQMREALNAEGIRIAPVSEIAGH